MSTQLAISKKVKVVHDFREYREWHDPLRYNVDDFRVGVIKNVVLRASYKIRCYWQKLELEIRI